MNENLNFKYLPESQTRAKLMSRIILYSFLILLSANLVFGQNKEQVIRDYIDSVYAANPEAVGFLIYVEAPEENLTMSYTVGYANRETHEQLLPSCPVLIASNTKPYVAGTILRLVERGRIYLDQPVKMILKPQSTKVLTDAGYNLDRITIMHLLSHTSGIRDYVDEGYFNFIDTHKKYKWTREEQIARAASEGAPLANPADTFRYADMNYLLLTEIIENITKKPFYESIRSLLNYKKHHLNDTWFVKLEEKPSNSNPLAHQYWDKYSWDTYDLDPSWDLYGGGGMAATVKDVAMYFQNLFNGKIVKNPNVLEMMNKDVPPNFEINYCLGIRKISISGLTCYNHGGGLGTDVVFIPKYNASIAVAALEASHRQVALKIRDEIVRLLGSE